MESRGDYMKSKMCHGIEVMVDKDGKVFFPYGVEAFRKEFVHGNFSEWDCKGYKKIEDGEISYSNFRSLYFRKALKVKVDGKIVL